MRGNTPVRRWTGFGRGSSCLVRDVVAGDLIYVEGKPYAVASVERLPPRHAGGGGRRKTP